MITNSSLSIVLKKVKEGTLTEEEAEIIINDIKRVNWYWPSTITYDNGFQQPVKKYEVTCSKTE